MTRSILAALAVAALLAQPLAPAVAQAKDEPNPGAIDEATELALRAAQKLMEVLQTFIEKIPQYEAPEILPNGDIIIRRKPKPPEKAPEPGAKPKETRT